MHANNYFDVFIYLISSSDNLRNRSTLLSRNLEEFEGKFKEVQEKVSASSDETLTENREISMLFKEIHYSELEVIQRINILIELLAVYYRMIRTNLRELPRSIGKTDFGSRELYREFVYFINQTQTDVWSNFRYPDVSHFPELSNNDQNTLRELLEQSAQNILGAFREIYQFQRNFRPVYNKYKHTLSEFTGVFGINKARKLVQTHIYLRHKEDEKYFSYVIPASFDEVIYFSEISARAHKLLRALIDNTLLFLANEGKDFIPRTLFIEKKYEGIFRELAAKIKSCIVPNFASRMIVSLPDPKSLHKINDKLRKYHIHMMERDILDTRGLLEKAITISEKQ